MMYIDLASDYGIVIRWKALEAIGVKIENILDAMELDTPLDSNDDLISLGPCFGGEAADELHRRLERIGLNYIDDFFIFFGDFPNWCKFKVGLVSSS